MEDNLAYTSAYLYDFDPEFLLPGIFLLPEFLLPRNLKDTLTHMQNDVDLCEYCT